MAIEMEKMMQVCDEAKELLAKNKNEWEPVYAGYAASILKNVEKIKTRKSYFNQWSPLHVYSTVGLAKSGTNSFQLRYLGQNVAKLKVKNGKVLLNTKEFVESNRKFFDYPDELIDVDWTGVEGKELRKHFSHLSPEKKPRQHEHMYESMILTEMEKTTKESKFQGSFFGVQPVKIAEIARFQMKTPFKASKAGELNYVSSSGGGIDILGRVGRGKPTLSVFELKEPNILDPQNPIEQGLAYTVFLRELLRSQSGSEWYKIFGYKGKLPAKIRLNCVALMGSGASLPGFEKNIIPLGKDEVHLHYMFYNEVNGGIEISDSSLVAGSLCS